MVLPPTPPLPSRSSQSKGAEFPVLDSSFPLPHGNGYTSILISQFVPPNPKHMSVLYSYPGNREERRKRKKEKGRKKEYLRRSYFLRIIQIDKLQKQMKVQI